MKIVSAEWRYLHVKFISTWLCKYEEKIEEWIQRRNYYLIINIFGFLDIQYFNQNLLKFMISTINCFPLFSIGRNICLNSIYFYYLSIVMMHKTYDSDNLPQQQQDKRKNGQIGKCDKLHFNFRIRCWICDITNNNNNNENSNE